MGASGIKVGVSCQNYVKLPEHELPDGCPWVHYSCTDMSKFIPHPVGSFQQLLEGLRAWRPAVSIGEFKLAEQSAGVNVDDDAVLVQSHMKGLANIPLSR